MQTPIETIRNWYTQLPSELQGEIGFLTLGSWPECDSGSHHTDDYGHALLDLIEKQATTPMSLLGTILTLKSLISFLFAERAKKDTWDEAKRIMQGVQELAEGELDHFIEPTMETLPFRAQQWRRAMMAWNTLQEAELSDESIRNWFNEAIRIRK